MARYHVWGFVIAVLAAVAIGLALASPEKKPDAPVNVVPVPPPLAATVESAPKPEAEARKPPQYAPPQPPAVAPTTVASAHAPWPQTDILAGSRGPIDEYRGLYNQQTRDAAATDVENGIRQAFTHSSLPDLLHSASCHESVCKLLIRWTPDRAREYIKAVRWLALGTAWPPGLPGFHSQIAFANGSETDRDGMRFVELFLMRRPMEAMWLDKPHVAQARERAANVP